MPVKAPGSRAASAGRRRRRRRRRRRSAQPLYPTPFAFSSTCIIRTPSPHALCHFLSSSNAASSSGNNSRCCRVAPRLPTETQAAMVKVAVFSQDNAVPLEMHKVGCDHVKTMYSRLWRTSTCTHACARSWRSRHSPQLRRWNLAHPKMPAGAHRSEAQFEAA